MSLTRFLVDRPSASSLSGLVATRVFSFVATDTPLQKCGPYGVVRSEKCDWSLKAQCRPRASVTCSAKDRKKESAEAMISSNLPSAHGAQGAAKKGRNRAALIMSSDPEDETGKQNDIQLPWEDWLAKYLDRSQGKLLAQMAGNKRAWEESLWIQNIRSK
ncbi:hypothetical protein C8J56DRAFT_899895 [Mycena floridula]|nr:hypothetical protein C8J56DRAFT_899895 [Mycena floridula]